MIQKVTYIILIVVLFLFTLNITILAEDLEIEKRVEDLEQDFNNFFKIEDSQCQQKYLQNLLNQTDELVEDFSENTFVLEVAATMYITLAEYHSDPLSIFRKGEKYAEKIREIEPNNGRGYFWEAAYMGEIGRERGIFNSLFNVRPMREKLENAIKKEPDFAPAYDVMARLYFEAPGWPLSIGNKRKALEYRKKSVELDPANYEYLWFLYENYIELGEKNNAKEVLHKIIEMPEDKESEFYYGKDISQEKKEKARKELRESD